MEAPQTICLGTNWTGVSFFWKDWRDSEATKTQSFGDVWPKFSTSSLDNLWHTLQVSSQPSFYSSIKLCGGFNLTIWYNMVVSWNRGTPELSHLIACSIWINPPIYGNPPLMVTKTESTPDVSLHDLHLRAEWKILNGATGVKNSKHLRDMPERCTMKCYGCYGFVWQ